MKQRSTAAFLFIFLVLICPKAFAEENISHTFVKYENGKESLVKINLSPDEIPFYQEGYVPPDINYFPPEKGLEKITDTTDFPWSSICKLILYYEDTDDYYTCSGAMADEFHLVTAAHCLMDSSGHWATAVQVVCGMDESEEPFGDAWAVNWSISQQYQDNPDYQESYEYDYGYLTLDRQKGNSTGWMGWRSESCDWFEGQPFYASGYPGGYCDGYCMYYDYATCDWCFTRYFVTGHHSMGGMSGGTAFYQDGDEYSKVGILSGGSEDEYTFFVKLTDQVWGILQDAWEDDAIPLDDYDEKWCGDHGFHYLFEEKGYCCQDNDPCGLAENGVCDCDDACSWDSEDCYEEPYDPGRYCKYFCEMIDGCNLEDTFGLDSPDQCLSACEALKDEYYDCGVNAVDCAEFGDCFGVSQDAGDGDDDDDDDDDKCGS